MADRVPSVSARLLRPSDRKAPRGALSLPITSSRPKPRTTVAPRVSINGRWRAGRVSIGEQQGYAQASMRLKLYVIHGSPPCAVVEKAMSMKALSYDVVEWPPPLHAPMQRVIFGD